MKKRLTAIILLIALLFSVPVVPVSRAAEKSWQKKTVTAYLFSMDEKTDMDILLRDDMPELAYVNMEQYMETVYRADYTFESAGDGIYCISVNIEGISATMTVDVNKDTVEYSDYFTLFWVGSNHEGDDNFAPVKIETNNELSENYLRSVTLNLADYDIDIVESDRIVYMPIPTLNDLCIMSYNAACYLNGRIFFYHTTDDIYEEPQYFEAERASLYESTETTAEMADYTYNELCFFVDHLFGRPSSARITKLLSAEGFDKVLDTLPKIKELLKSTRKTDVVFGLLNLVDIFYDGGHSVPGCGFSDINSRYPESALSKEFWERVNDKSDKVVQEAREKYFSTYSIQNPGMPDIRKKAFKKYKQIRKWGTDAALYVKGDMALFSFDLCNYEAIKAFKEALDIAQKKGLKSFIIDLGNNGGGDSIAEYYICTILDNSLHDAHTNSSCIYSLDVSTGSLKKTAFTIDLNMDGKIDDKDKDVRYDFEFAMITSKYSFSCANQISCEAAELGVPIFGERSGGGTCSLGLQYMTGGIYSFFSVLIKGVYEDGRDMDKGAPLTIDWMKPGYGKVTKDYADFYDPEILKLSLDGVKKKPQSMTVKINNKKVKASVLKKKKVVLKNAIRVKGSKGKLTITKTEGSDKKITVDNKGTVTIKKGSYKKGQKLTLRGDVLARGDKTIRYAKKTIVVTITVK